MCGIAGVRQYGERPIDELMIRDLLVSLEHRGIDACGIALQNSLGEVSIIKKDDSPWRFVVSDDYKDFIEEYLTDDTKIALVHTRAATKGNPRLAKNNHPMFSGKGAIIHNGVIHNDSELFRTLDLKREADTDSDIIRAIVDKFGITPEAINRLKQLRGSCASASIHPDYPGKILLTRSGSPLSVGSTSDGLFMFASEKNVIHRAMRPWHERFGVWFQEQSLGMAFSPMHDNAAWIMGEKKRDFFTDFPTYYGTYKEPVRKIYQGYKQRQADWTREQASQGTFTHKDFKEEPVVEEKKPEPIRIANAPVRIIPVADEPVKDHRTFVTCPKCQKPLVVPVHQSMLKLKDLACPKEGGGCGSSLEGAKVEQVL